MASPYSSILEDVAEAVKQFKNCDLVATYEWGSPEIKIEHLGYDAEITLVVKEKVR